MFTCSLNNGDFIPVGSVRQLGAGSLNIPAGWLACDGSAISRTLYKALFDVIGTSYGAGDGTTTFNLPTQSAIISTINDTVAVAGTSKTLGLSDGSKEIGIYSASSGSGYYLLPRQSLYNVDKGTSASGSGVALAGIGVSSESDKSGLTGTVTKQSVPYVFIIKY